jgi:hypothetical protein
VSYSHLARLHWHCVTRDVRYEARTEHELPVLVRYIPKELLEPAGICIPDATVLDLILYSREQIAEEYKSMGRENTSSLLPDAEWSIISVKPQTESFETPMQPITMCSSPLCVFSISHIPMDVLSGCGTAWAWPRAAAQRGVLERPHFNRLMTKCTALDEGRSKIYQLPRRRGARAAMTLIGR